MEIWDSAVWLILYLWKGEEIEVTWLDLVEDLDLSCLLFNFSRNEIGIYFILRYLLRKDEPPNDLTSLAGFDFVSFIWISTRQQSISVCVSSEFGFSYRSFDESTKFRSYYPPHFHSIHVLENGILINPSFYSGISSPKVPCSPNTSYYSDRIAKCHNYCGPEAQSSRFPQISHARVTLEIQNRAPRIKRSRSGFKKTSGNWI